MVVGGGHGGVRGGRGFVVVVVYASGARGGSGRGRGDRGGRFVVSICEKVVVIRLFLVSLLKRVQRQGLLSGRNEEQEE